MGGRRGIRGLLAIPLRFALAYGLLMAPWPGLSESYGRLYAASAAFLYDSADADRRVDVAYAAPRPGSEAERWGQDCVVSLWIRGPRVGGRAVPPFATARSSRYTGWAPTALTLALVFAAPIGWRRRLRALPGAALLASGFAASMLGFWIQGWFTAQHWAWLAQSSPHYAWRARFLASLLETSGSFGPYFLGPVLLAALASLRRRDLDALLAGAARRPGA